MEFEVFSESIIGYKNLAKNKISQDYCEYKKMKNGIICALADGHSTDFFEYSHIGAKLACKAGINVLESYIKEHGYDLNNIKEDLDSSTIQKNIYDKWLELVNEHYKKNSPVVFRTQYSKYSTTLVLLLISEKLRLYFNIGDSTILIRRNEEYMKVLGNNNGFLVKSLGSEDAYKNMEYYLEIVSEEYKNDYTIIFSDGYSDGFDSFKEMIIDLNSTIDKYEKSIFSKFLLNKNYKAHLQDISKYKTYDDVTIMFIKSKYK